jgi:galactose mutarotase-like enzyme
MSDDLVTIGSGELTARISPLGAELWSLTDAAGAEYMTDADPAFWSGRAPLLFPIVGSLSGDVMRLDGREFTLPRHGFARHRQFAAVHVDGGEARFRLTDSPDTRAVYPFGFVLEMTFRIEGMTLRMEASVFNPNAEALPFSFGFHPAFAWPLPGGFPKQDHRLVFEKFESPTLRQLIPNSGELSPNSVPTPANSRELLLSEDLFRNDALIWDVFESKSLTYGVDGGTNLDLHFPDTTSMGVWQVPGARYICIEPWQGYADPQGFTGDFREKPGVVLLDPGKTRSFRMDVTVRPG